MDKAQIIKAIASIGKTANKLRIDVQAAAVGCVEHAHKHGDVTLADKLVEALGKGMRRASLRAWFETNGPMFIPKGKDTFAFDSSRKVEWNSDIADSLASIPWEEAKPEPKVESIFDVSDAFDRFMKRVESMAKDEAVSIRNRELLETLRNAGITYHNKQAMMQRIDTPAE